MSGFRLIGFFLLLCLVCCKEETTNRIVFETLQATEITQDEVTFNAVIKVVGNLRVDDYGFVWANHTLPQANSTSTFYFGQRPMRGEFSHRTLVENPGSENYVRAFVKMGTSIIYGNEIKFSSLLFDSGPVIADFTPKEGAGLTQITITGDYFTGNYPLVMIGPVYCSVESIARQKLVVTLPAGVNVSGKYKLKITIGAKTVISNDYFTIPGPLITSVSPAGAPPGSTVVISGNNFSPDPAGNVVMFGEFRAVVTEATSEQIKAVVVTVYSPRIVPLSVQVGQYTTYAVPDFEIEGPKITDFSPHEDYAGGIITITGRNFSSVPEENLVVYHHQPLTVLTATPTQLTVKTSLELSAYAYLPEQIVVNTLYPGTYLEGISLQKFTILSPWQKISQVGGSTRAFATGFSIGSYGYIGTGIAVDLVPQISLNDFWQFDPVTNSWLKKADFPGESRYWAFGFTVNGKGYIGGGIHSAPNVNSYVKKDLWEYDPQNDSWTKKKDFPSLSPVTDLNRIVTAMGVGDRGYIVDLIDVYDYDPATDTWTKHANRFPGRSTALNVSFGIGDKGYYGLGLNNQGDNNKQFWEYDPAGDSWTRLSDYPGTSTYENFSFVIGAKGYVGNIDFFEFDQGSKLWTRLLIPPLTMYNAVGFGINGKGYVGTGQSSGTIPDIYVYNPDYLSP